MCYLAEDRCHRIGQKKPVTVIKMVADESVDADIYNMQERKAKMNAAIMDTTTDWSKQEKKEKAQVMKNVVDRFLKSPSSRSPKEGRTKTPEEKENVINLTEDEETDI